MASEKGANGEYGEGSPLRSLEDLKDEVANRPGSQNSFETLALELLTVIAQTLDSIDTRLEEMRASAEDRRSAPHRPQGSPRYE